MVEVGSGVAGDSAGSGEGPVLLMLLLSGVVGVTVPVGVAAVGVRGTA